MIARRTFLAAMLAAAAGPAIVRAASLMPVKAIPLVEPPRFILGAVVEYGSAPLSEYEQLACWGQVLGTPRLIGETNNDFRSRMVLSISSGYKDRGLGAPCQ